MHTCRSDVTVRHTGCIVLGRWVDESGLQESSKLTVHVKQLSVYTRYEAVRQDWMERGRMEKRTTSGP